MKYEDEPIYPQVRTEMTDLFEEGTIMPIEVSYRGLTKKEYYLGIAASILPPPAEYNSIERTTESYDVWAEKAIGMVDALIRVLEATNE